MKPSNHLSIPEFKKMYIKALKKDGKDLSVEQVRMFAMGKELKDDLFLYSYEIPNEMTV